MQREGGRGNHLVFEQIPSHTQSGRFFFKLEFIPDLSHVRVVIEMPGHIQLVEVEPYPQEVLLDVKDGGCQDLDIFIFMLMPGSSASSLQRMWAKP